MLPIWYCLPQSARDFLARYQRKHHDALWQPPAPLHSMDKLPAGETVKTMTARPHYERGTQGGST